MGKITIKHYLNTDVKEGRSEVYVVNDDCKLEVSEKDTTYPVYLLITFNRKTTKLRSYTAETLYKQEFAYYQEHGTYYGEKKSNYYNPDKYLANELEKAYCSLDYFYNGRQGDQEVYSIKNVLDFYMLEFGSSLFLKDINKETIFTIENPSYSFIDKIIKADAPVIDMINFFSEVLKVNIFDELDKESSDLLKGAELFFFFMPKDKQGNTIGRLIDWYKDESLKTSFKKYIHSKKGSPYYFDAFNNLMSYIEKYRIKRYK